MKEKKFHMFEVGHLTIHYKFSSIKPSMFMVLAIPRHISVCRNNQQDLFNILGYMYAGTIFTGINCCSSVIPFVAIERTVVYRENFAGMYSPWAYSFAQVR